MGSNSRTWMLLVALASLGAPGNAQTPDLSVPAGGPFSSQPVVNAPFSAEATTRFHRVSADGSKREDTLTARYYRDSAGRVRAELDTQWGPYTIVSVPGPLAPAPGPVRSTMYYWFDLQKRTYQLGPGYPFAAHVFNGEGRVAIPLAKACFQLAAPVVLYESDQERLHAVNAQGLLDLSIVTASQRSDGIVTVDYKVTNIRRGEPSPQLFDVTDFTFEGPAAALGVHDDEWLVRYAPWNATSCRPPSKH
jgi:hypothetical protein